MSLINDTLVAIQRQFIRVTYTPRFSREAVADQASTSRVKFTEIQRVSDPCERTQSADKITSWWTKECHGLKVFQLQSIPLIQYDINSNSSQSSSKALERSEVWGDPSQPIDQFGSLPVLEKVPKKKYKVIAGLVIGVAFQWENSTTTDCLFYRLPLLIGDSHGLIPNTI